MRAHPYASWPIIIALLFLGGVAGAQSEFREFPEFRYTSGLPGGGWGVTPDGVPGFDGAMLINVPVAYTPHRGVMVGYSSGSLDSTPRLEFGGRYSNGTGWIALGLGRSGHGLYLCEMPTGKSFDTNFGEPVENVQQQLLPERPTASPPSRSVFRTSSKIAAATSAPPTACTTPIRSTSLPPGASATSSARST